MPPELSIAPEIRGQPPSSSWVVGVRSLDAESGDHQFVIVAWSIDDFFERISSSEGLDLFEAT